MLFDPSIYDNLKVAFENQLYDLDNLDARITVTGRRDLLDMAVMSRTFAIRFALREAPAIEAELLLEASLAELAAEMMELAGQKPGCRLTLRFHQQLPRETADADCARIRDILAGIWEPEQPPIQTLQYKIDETQPASTYAHAAELTFNRKIDEEQMEDLPDLLEHALRTLEELVAARK
ncbi:hypothetical protein [Paenibacillus methanolicus]|uniref:Uncharacterized protein n=1 Tax=Paenibacillus methanolicus TaxID=582686 RepID=A0A5S5BT58_9BACL|nr:hypothetical protein [Paenibacillus methanolicus]TYP70124.1 hypothetical protein BCM02_112102 [Paenibacillus methanolicus]